MIQTADSSYTVPATQEALDSRGISIQLSKFKENKIKKAISIPNTYVPQQGHPQGVQAVLFAPIKGIYDSIEVILFVLVLGGFIGVFNSSGALNMGVGYLAHLLKGREGILIILLTTLLALGGTSFGLAEETLAFYPMLVPIFLAAGYDLIVPLAVIYIGSKCRLYGIDYQSVCRDYRLGCRRGRLDFRTLCAPNSLSAVRAYQHYLHHQVRRKGKETPREVYRLWGCLTRNIRL